MYWTSDQVLVKAAARVIVVLFFKAGRSLFGLLPPGIEMGSAILLARGNLKKNALDHSRRANMPCKGGAEIP